MRVITQLPNDDLRRSQGAAQAAELDARIKSETVKWKKVIEAAGLKPE